MKWAVIAFVLVCTFCAVHASSFDDQVEEECPPCNAPCELVADEDCEAANDDDVEEEESLMMNVYADWNRRVRGVGHSDNDKHVKVQTGRWLAKVEGLTLTLENRANDHITIKQDDWESKVVKISGPTSHVIVRALMQNITSLFRDGVAELFDDWMNFVSRQDSRKSMRWQTHLSFKHNPDDEESNNGSAASFWITFHPDSFTVQVLVDGFDWALPNFVKWLANRWEART